MYYIVLLQYLFLYIFVILLFICIVQPKALYFADLLINLLACLLALKKENGPRASSAPALGLNTIIFKHVYWYMQQTQVSVYRTIGPLVFLSHQIKALQKNHEDAKSVNKEIASTLESVMSSHSQLQSVVEGLQIELGKKDSHLSRLKNEKLVLLS